MVIQGCDGWADDTGWLMAHPTIICACDIGSLRNPPSMQSCLLIPASIAGCGHPGQVHVTGKYNMASASPLKISSVPSARCAVDEPRASTSSAGKTISGQRPRCEHAFTTQPVQSTGRGPLHVLQREEHGRHTRESSA